jgi:hypothetical protein
MGILALCGRATHALPPTLFQSRNLAMEPSIGFRCYIINFYFRLFPFSVHPARWGFLLMFQRPLQARSAVSRSFWCSGQQDPSPGAERQPRSLCHLRQDPARIRRQVALKDADAHGAAICGRHSSQCASPLLGIDRSSKDFHRGKRGQVTYARHVGPHTLRI